MLYIIINKQTNLNQQEQNWHLFKFKFLFLFPLNGKPVTKRSVQN